MIGTGPIPGADVNKVIFFSDGEPNRALENGDGHLVDEDEAIDQSENEIDAIETDGDGLGPEQAFDIEAFGANTNNGGLDVLDEIDSNNAENVTTNDRLGRRVGEPARIRWQA